VTELPFLVVLEKNVLPYRTMATDHYSMQMLQEMPDIAGMIRFYTWQTPAISLGYFQKHSVLNHDNLKADGVPFVRRYTGGNAIYHDDDLSWAVTVRQGMHGITDKRSFYQVVARIIQKALYSLGVEVFINMERGGTSNTPNCYQSVSQYEITDREGRKITGAAQRINGDVFLQQGTFFTRSNRTGLQRYLVADTDNQIADGTGNALVHDRLSIDDLQGALVRTAQDTFPVKHYTFNSQNRMSIDYTVKNQYSTDEWNCSK
jgi:lipoate-protein ligase A